MIQSLPQFLKIFLCVFSLFVLEWAQPLFSQCTNATPYGTVTAPFDNTPLTISTCNYQTEYSTVNSVAAGETYEATYSLGGCITVHSGTPGGPVVASGTTPLTWVATVSGTHYIHYNTTCACGTATSCGVSTITCTSCTGGGGGGGDPCLSITPLIGCGTSMNANMSGTGSWDNFGCAFSTPGVESIFSFTATASGIHSLDVTAATGGYVDFMWKPATAGCSSTGWTCIGDLFSAGNYGAMNWTIGETYYILLDPEGIGAFSFTFDINCPNPDAPSVAGDCDVAIPICTDLDFAIDPNGFGLVDELCTSCITNPSLNPGSLNSGCLNSGELNSTWMTVNVAVGGSLEFSFGAPAGGNCFDWMMWTYDDNTCAGIASNTHPPIRCNWNSPCDGFTGVAGTLPVGGQTGNFEPPLSVDYGNRFLICFSNYSSAVTNVPLSFFGSADISCTPVLGVDILSFEGTSKETHNELVWATATEVNSAYFDIEKGDAQGNFRSIGQVSSAGTSFSTQHYSFLDDQPGDKVDYYRLKKMDKNGQFEYSEIVAIAQPAPEEFHDVQGYPNPALDVFTVEYSLRTRDVIKVEVMSAMGQSMKAFDHHSELGNNQIQLSVSDFAAGVYFVQLTNTRTHQRFKIKLVTR